MSISSFLLLTLGIKTYFDDNYILCWQNCKCSSHSDKQRFNCCARENKWLRAADYVNFFVKYRSYEYTRVSERIRLFIDIFSQHFHSSQPLIDLIRSWNAPFQAFPSPNSPWPPHHTSFLHLKNYVENYYLNIFHHLYGNPPKWHIFIRAAWSLKLNRISFPQTSCL